MSSKVLTVPAKKIISRTVSVIRRAAPHSIFPEYAVWHGDIEAFLGSLSNKPIFDLVVTSPPYNLGKEYERDGLYAPRVLTEYIAWQSRVIRKTSSLLKPTGSICWQVGNYVNNGAIMPLDILLAPVFKSLNLQLRNRIVWRFGHGLHCKRRFSGRYEVVMWYTKTDDYYFNLDAVRIPQKYPGKKYFKGPRVGTYSSNPRGKNPEDVWDIPNVKSNHVEKTAHPCQFPVGLVERLVLSLTRPGGLVFDPFAGVCSTGVAAALHGRRFIGCEVLKKYIDIGVQRVNDTLSGHAKYRPHSKPIYDHTKSSLSIKPQNYPVEGSGA